MLEPEPRVMAVLEVVRLTAEGPPDMAGRPVDLVDGRGVAGRDQNATAVEVLNRVDVVRVVGGAVLGIRVGVGERDVMDSFERGFLQQAAAFRDAPFPDEEVDFEKIVRRSDMSEEQQRYWLSLDERDL